MHIYIQASAISSWSKWRLAVLYAVFYSGGFLLVCHCCLHSIFTEWTICIDMFILDSIYQLAMQVKIHVHTMRKHIVFHNKEILDEKLKKTYTIRSPRCNRLKLCSMHNLKY